MRKQRSYSAEFKRQVVEELLSGVNTVAHIMLQKARQEGGNRIFLSC